MTEMVEFNGFTNGSSDFSNKNLVKIRIRNDKVVSIEEVSHKGSDEKNLLRLGMINGENFFLTQEEFSKQDTW